MNERIRLAAIQLQQYEKTFYLVRMRAADLGRIAYASVRGQHDEAGAVQRVLNTRRIQSIKDFALRKGDFPASIVLNWVHPDHVFRVIQDTEIEIPLVERSAQLIDGQHRVAGLKEAILESPELANLEIPVAIYHQLTTKECADIFLSINTEQKPVPRTLVYDLYEIADDALVDSAAARARDIAIALNEEEDSPYYDQIKLPGSPRRRGGIALSTAVTAIKPLVAEKGDFEQRGICEFETQKKVVKNLFQAISEIYGDDWYERTNAFMYAAGFAGATDFLRTKLLSYGQSMGKFTTNLFRDALSELEGDPITQEEVKGLGGKDAPQKILDRLNQVFRPAQTFESVFEV